MSVLIGIVVLMILTGWALLRRGSDVVAVLALILSLWSTGFGLFQYIHKDKSLVVHVRDLQGGRHLRANLVFVNDGNVQVTVLGVRVIYVYPSIDDYEYDAIMAGSSGHKAYDDSRRFPVAIPGESSAVASVDIPVASHKSFTELPPAYVDEVGLVQVHLAFDVTDSVSGEWITKSLHVYNVDLRRKARTFPPPLDSDGGILRVY